MHADWHREDIKAAVRKTGITLRKLAQEAGFSTWAVSRALDGPWPTMEAIIARRLRLHPSVIWPSRYDATGAPLRARRAAFAAKRIPNTVSPSRQKRVSA